jgi:hypothetical protein
VATTPTSPTFVVPTEPTTTPTPAQAVQAWQEHYEGNIQTLDSDQENIDTADQELEQSGGNYSPLFSAIHQLASDVATAQALPAIPDSQAEADWTAELSDLATAATDFNQGFTDISNGDATDGVPLKQSAETETDQAQIQENDLDSRLSVAGAG